MKIILEINKSLSILLIQKSPKYTCLSVCHIGKLRTVCKALISYSYIWITIRRSLSFQILAVKWIVPSFQWWPI